MAKLKNTTIDDSGFLQLPVGTTEERPEELKEGQIRYNSSKGNSFEIYNRIKKKWSDIENKPIDYFAINGNVYDIKVDEFFFRVHEFRKTGSSKFIVNEPIDIEYLIVAGGGGGGSTGSLQAGGGGGAGGVISGETSLEKGEYEIFVGEGGAPGDSSRSWDGYNGEDSSAFGFVAIGGGGGGGSQDRNGRDGGSGGGRASGGGAGRGGFGTSGQGNRGGNGNSGGGNSNVSPFNAGGGGGAGGTGGDSTSLNRPPLGGIGILNDITGNSLYYGGGGGAGQRNLATGVGFGGYGGGGAGGDLSGNRARNGVPGTGGGGGGGQGDSRLINAGFGGSGIIIIRYKIGMV